MEKYYAITETGKGVSVISLGSYEGKEEARIESKKILFGESQPIIMNNRSAISLIQSLQDGFEIEAGLISLHGQGDDALWDIINDKQLIISSWMSNPSKTEEELVANLREKYIFTYKQENYLIAGVTELVEEKQRHISKCHVASGKDRYILN